MSRPNRVMESWPLSASQEGMLYQCMAQPGVGCYVEQVVCRLREQLDPASLGECWQAVVDRHSILRSCFACDDAPVPQQSVVAHATVPVYYDDWRELAPDLRETRLDAFRCDDRQRGFNLCDAPLMRVAIFRLDDAEYEMLWTVHHIVVDGRSIQQLLREVFETYAARMRGETPTFPELPSFGGYAAWLKAQPMEAAEKFWRGRLSELHEATEIPTIPPPGDPVKGPAHGHLRRQLSPTRTAALNAFAEANGLTLNIVLMGAWALLLHRYCDSADVVFGATKSVRHGVADTSSVGPYINTLPIRTQLDADVLLLPWLKALREQWVALRAFEHTPYERIRACCDVPGGAPLYTSYYVFERETLDASMRAMGGEWHSRAFRLHEHTPVPLMLAGYGGVLLLLSLEFDARHLSAADAERMLGHLENLLDAIPAQAEAPAGRLPLFAPDALEQLLRNCAPVPVPPVSATHLLFESAAATWPDAIALGYRDESLTYAELNRRSNQLALRLRVLGVKADARVAVCLPLRTDAVMAILAVFKAGGAYVPLDPAYPADRLQYMLEDSEAMVLISEPGLASRLHVGALPVVRPGEGVEERASEVSGNIATQVAPEDLAYIIYTSGSTGRPKGVCVEHGAAAQHFVAMREVYGIVPEDRVLQFASLSFDVSLEQIFVALIAGATLVLADDTMYAAPTFSSVLRRTHTTVLNLPPAFWQQWTDEGIACGDDEFGAQFRLLIVGSDVVLPTTVRQWQAHPSTRAVPLMNAYGPTETVITAMYYDVPPGFGADVVRERVPIGAPIRGTEAIVLDRFQNPVPPGLPGELYLGGNRLARGYHRQPQLTARAFVPHPWRTESGALLYRTGDRVRQLRDGNFEFLGRIDDQVKIRGYRIELREVELALLRCVGLREAVVRCRNDAAGEAHLAAYIVAEHGAVVEVASLTNALRSTLPVYMIPEVFILLKALPVTVNGKVDYAALSGLTTTEIRASTEYVAPKTEMQARVADIWRDVLNHDVIGIEDSFYNLGGHSLRAARVVTRIRAEFGVEIALGDFLLAPTVRALADKIVHALTPDDCVQDIPLGQKDPCIVPIQTSGTKPPLYCVLGAGSAEFAYGALAKHLGPDQPVYGLQYSHLPESAEIFTVESVAARYLTALQSAQPTGPYRLAGWSFGGLVAYEMARQLQETKHQVAFLAIVDCEARLPVVHSMRNTVSALRRKIESARRKMGILIHTWDAVLLHVGDMIRLMGRSVFRGGSKLSLRDYVDYARGNILITYAMRQGGIERADSTGSRLDMADDRFVKNVVSGLRANERAGKAYLMKPYRGVVTLFRTRSGSSDTDSGDLTMGYALLADKVDVVVVEGNHYTLVKEPCVGLLAGQIAAHLEVASLAVAE